MCWGEEVSWVVVSGEKEVGEFEAGDGLGEDDGHGIDAGGSCCGLDVGDIDGWGAGGLIGIGCSWRSAVEGAGSPAGGPAPVSEVAVGIVGDE